MGKAVVAKMFRFEASHQIPNHKGKCSRLHGHSYRVVVGVKGTVRPLDGGSSDEGMVADFDEIKTVVQPLIDSLDHQHLNEFLSVPTAERIAEYILREATQFKLTREVLDGKKKVYWKFAFVRVYETATTYAEVCP